MDEFTAAAIDTHLERIACALEAMLALQQQQQTGPLRERYRLLTARVRDAASTFQTYENAALRGGESYGEHTRTRHIAAEELLSAAHRELDAFRATYPDLVREWEAVTA